jgi:hypothetical protein
MQPIHFLIDGEGRTLSSPFVALRKATNRDVAEHALIAHAVEKLGYVHVQEWPRGLLVFYRAPGISPVTLAGSIYLLADLADKRVIFSVHDGHMRYSLYQCRSQAVRRLMQEMRNLESDDLQTDRAVPNVEQTSDPLRSVARRRTT